MKNNKSIAILGGMGPQASAKLLEVIVNMATVDFGAEITDDFPEVILNSIPIADFISDKKSIRVVFQTLKRSVRRMENFNPVSFSIACNTAHVLLNDLQAETDIPFISIIEEVVKSVSNAQLEKVGILATPTTIKSRLYQEILKKRGIRCVALSQKGQRTTEGIIRNVLAGKINNNDRKKLITLAKDLQIQGAQGIILGCTELPLIFPGKFNLPVFNSIEILARSLLINFYEQKFIPEESDIQISLGTRTS